jgi:hypothetical protein
METGVLRGVKQRAERGFRSGNLYNARQAALSGASGKFRARSSGSR